MSELTHSVALPPPARTFRVGTLYALQAIFLMVCSFFVVLFLLPVFAFTEEKYTPRNEYLLIGFERFSQVC